MLDHQQVSSAKRLRGEYNRFYEKLVQTAGREFLKYLYGFFMRVYELDFEGKHMKKTEAANYIPLEHATTRRKHLERAAKLGFLKFQRSATDGRVWLVLPGPKLKPFVTGEIEELNAIEMPSMEVSTPKKRT